MAPASQTAPARELIVPCISWTRSIGDILLLVCFDDDGTRCEGRPALEEDGALDEDGAADEGGPDDVLGKDWDKPIYVDVVLFFIAGSANEKAPRGVEVLSLCLPLEAETAVDDLSSLSISINESSVIDESLMLSLMLLVSAAAPLPDTSGWFTSDTPNISDLSTSML